MDALPLPNLTPRDLHHGLLSLTAPNLFPSRVAGTALGPPAAHGRLLRVLRGQLRSGYRPSLVETVLVPKLDQTTRPAVNMSLQDQIVFSTLTESIKRSLPDGLVSFTDSDGAYDSYDDFEQFPLSPAARSAYVVEADVSSFYSYVDHERLGREVVGITGVVDEMDCLIELLSAWMSSSRGLPQGPSPSAILADIYLSAVDRTLQRSGVEFSRYSDDYRILAGDWPAPKERLLQLESALADAGLALASGKVRFYKLETYRAVLERLNPRNARSAASERILRAEPVVVNESMVSDVLSEQVIERDPDVFGARLIRWSLAQLTTLGSTAAVQYLVPIAQRYPQLTNELSVHLCKVMAARPESESEIAAAVWGWMRAPGFAFPWQIGWLIRPLTTASVEVGESLEWARSELANLELTRFRGHPIG